MRRLLTVGIILVFGFWILNVMPQIIYPAKYSDYVVEYSKEFSLDPLFVFAVIKKESKFNPNAVSNKGAIGLMQIMPQTGGNGAEALGLLDFNEEMLYEPDINIRIGCWYLSKLYREYGTLQSVLAAYNAGGSKLKKWFEGVDYKNIEEDEFLNRVPYYETRFFVEGVLSNYKMYSRIYKDL